MLITKIVSSTINAEEFTLDKQDYFEKQDANVFVLSNWHNKKFSDSKMSGV